MTDRATDDQIAEWHAHLEDDSTTPDAVVLADALGSVLCELNAERNRWFDAMTRMECETGCGNCNVCRLLNALEAKKTQHAETLGLLEHAYKVIEAQNRPPLGYTVLSKTEVRLMPGSFHYTASGPVTESIFPAEQLAAERKGHRKKCVIAELREVPGE